MAKKSMKTKEITQNPLFSQASFDYKPFSPVASQASRIIPLNLSSIIVDTYHEEVRAIELMNNDSIDHRLMAEFCGREEHRKAMMSLLNDRELYHSVKKATFPGSARFSPGEVFYLLPALTDTVAREVSSRSKYATLPSTAIHLYTKVLDAQWGPFNARGTNSTSYAMLEVNDDATASANREVLVGEVIRKEILAALENYTFTLKDVNGKKLSIDLYTDTILHNMSQIAAALGRVAQSEQAFNDMLTLLRIYLDPSEHEQLDKEYRQFLTEPLMREIAGNATLVNLAVKSEGSTIWTPAWYLERAIQGIMTEVRGSSRLSIISLDNWKARFYKTSIRAVSGELRGVLVSQNFKPQGVSQVTEFVRESEKLDSWSQIGFRSIETRFDEVSKSLANRATTEQLHNLLASTMCELDGPQEVDITNPSYSGYTLFCDGADIELLAMACCSARLLKNDDDGSTVGVGYEIDLAGKHYKPNYASSISSHAVVTDAMEALMLIEDFDATTSVTVANQVIPTNVRSRYLIGNPNKISTKLDAQLVFSVNDASVNGSLLQLVGLTGFGRLRATNPVNDCSFYETFFTVCNYIVSRAEAEQVKESINTVVAVRLHDLLSVVTQHDLISQMHRSVNTRLIALARETAGGGASIELATKLRTDRYSKVLRVQCALFLMTRLGLIGGSSQQDDSATVDINFVHDLIESVRFFERT